MTLNRIRQGSQTDIPQIKQIWEASFTTDQNYLQLVFGSLFPLCTTYVYEEKGEILSTLMLVPISLQNNCTGNTIPVSATPLSPSAIFPTSLSGKYLYGVATHPRARGRKLSNLILKTASAEITEKGDAFILARPAQESLFSFYREQGFTLDVPRGTFTLPEPFLLATEAYFKETSPNTDPKQIAPEHANREKILMHAAKILFTHLAQTHPLRYEWPIEIIQHMIKLGEFAPSTSALTITPSPTPFALVKLLAPHPTHPFSNAFFNFTME